MMIILGLIFPPIIDLINKFVKDSSIRFLVAFSFCALFGVGLNWIETGFIFSDRLMAFQSLSESILVVFGASQLSYKLVYDDSVVQTKIRG